MSFVEDETNDVDIPYKHAKVIRSDPDGFAKIRFTTPDGLERIGVYTGYRGWQPVKDGDIVSGTVRKNPFGFEVIDMKVDK